MGVRAVVARRELGGIVRERTILLAVLIQVLVAGFSGFLVLGLSAVADPAALPSHGQPTIAVNASALPPELQRDLAEAGIAVAPYPSDGAAWDAFRSGDAFGALLVQGGGPVHATLALPDGDLRATSALLKAKTGLEQWERSLRAAASDRLEVQPLYVATEQPAGTWGFAYSLLVPLLVLLPTVLAGALCADAVTEEIQRGTLPLLLVAPATPAQVLEGKLFANALVAPLLAAAWLGLLALNGLGSPLDGALAILALAAAGAVVLGVLAMALGLATRDRNKAQVLYALAFMLVLALAARLPLSPGSAVAQLAGGSATLGAYEVVGATMAAALGAWAALRFALARRLAAQHGAA